MEIYYNHRVNLHSLAVSLDMEHIWCHRQDTCLYHIDLHKYWWIRKKKPHQNMNAVSVNFQIIWYEKWPIFKIRDFVNYYSKTISAFRYWQIHFFSRSDNSIHLTRIIHSYQSDQAPIEISTTLMTALWYHRHTWHIKQLHPTCRHCKSIHTDNLMSFWGFCCCCFDKFSSPKYFWG